MNLKCEAFAIFADAEVVYDGRASSTLERGNYLIIKKEDGSLMVHGANHVPALNYMSSGTTVEVDGDTIIAIRRSETIRIKIHKLHNTLLLPDWSAHKIKIRKTEAELVEKIINNPEEYLGPGSYTAHREYQTTAGPIDIIMVYGNTIYVIEAKRKKVTLKDCYQDQRYLDALAKSSDFSGCEMVGCLAGPDISANALSHCSDNGFRYLRVLFE